MKYLLDHQKGILAIVVAAILWSTGGIFIKLTSLSPMQISFFRCLFAAVVFLFVFRRKLLKVNFFTFINAGFYAAVLILYVIATKTTTAANAVFLQYTAPIYVLIFEPLINKTKYEKINIITIIICFIGMLLFFTDKLSGGNLYGDIIALLSGIAFAAFLLGMRKNKKEHQFVSIFYGNIFVVLISVYSIFEINTLSITDLLMVSYLGIFQVGAAYIIFAYGLKRVLAVEASLISMIEPVLNPVWVLIGYGEIPSVMAIIGGGIILFTISVRAFILQSAVMKARYKNYL
ncbi:MAG: EamA family transporter [Bacteroidetes bacterium]|nr:EamA family transporter [Bacteroidota bacterium]